MRISGRAGFTSSGSRRMSLRRPCAPTSSAPAPPATQHHPQTRARRAVEGDSLGLGHLGTNQPAGWFGELQLTESRRVESAGGRGWIAGAGDAVAGFTRLRLAHLHVRQRHHSSGGYRPGGIPAPSPSLREAAHGDTEKKNRRRLGLCGLRWNTSEAPGRAPGSPSRSHHTGHWRPMKSNVSTGNSC